MAAFLVLSLFVDQFFYQFLLFIQLFHFGDFLLPSPIDATHEFSCKIIWEHFKHLLSWMLY